MQDNTQETYRYSGRDFTASELHAIRTRITNQPKLNRMALSIWVCEELNWRKPDGGVKDMSCRVALLRMEKDGWFELPPPQRRNGNGKWKPKVTPATDPRPLIVTPAGKLGPLRLEMVATQRESKLWNEYIERYHYLGYQPLPGAQLRYFVFAKDRLVALLGFGAAAWAVAPRDRWIGWSSTARQKNLPCVVNNARFLILPWIQSKNLASRILGALSRRLSSDWHKRYKVVPVLLETFVEAERFRGTCYKAANWIHVGQTKGRGKKGPNKPTVPIKDIWVYPIIKKFRDFLL